MFDRVDRLIGENMDGLVQALSRLLSIPSCKSRPEPDAPYGSDTKRALEEFLRLGEHMGFVTRNIDNMAGYIEFGQGPAMVAALGHLDVVPPGDGWTADPFTPVVTAERIIARGAIDDKGPVIACLFALKALRDAGFAPRTRIRLIVGLDEESGSSCMARYVRTEELPCAGFTPDADFPAIYAEKGILHLRFQTEMPPAIAHADGPVIVYMKGGDRANVVPSRCEASVSVAGAREFAQSFSGIPAHGSTPDQGVNAISSAMRSVHEWLSSRDLAHPFVDFYHHKFHTETDGHALGIACRDNPSGALTCNAGMVELDDERARLTVDIRYPVTADAEALLATLRGQAAPYGISLVVLQHQKPLYLAPDTPMITTLTRIYREVTGRDEPPVAIGGGTYARTMPNIVAYGPGMAGDPEMAHKADEYITLERLQTCCRIYARALAALSEEARPEPA